MEKKIAVLGGGTGISTILRGLKHHTKNISAIVSMSDDGGGSGILREELNILPPGDVRRCLIALSNTDETLKDLLNYRFNSGTLKNQNVGNILIAALTDIFGSFDRALIEMSSVFNVTGKIIPVTLDETHLVAEFLSKDKVVGESYIPKMCYRLNTKIEKMSMIPHYPRANKEALKAILDADIVIIGPGSLYTSIIPNFLIAGIDEALRDTKAHVIYIANAMTQRGETKNYSLKDHFDAILKHSNYEFIDEVIANDFRATNDVYQYYYTKEESTPIFATDDDRTYFKEKNVELTEGDFIEIKDGFIRHDGNKIGASIFKASLL
ncbi:YvcK family protein [Peptoniphilus sp. AGMB00490]|uniref:Putative gluconeogenesis factor n=1 Tax=Peptoniphilus faecalis TaxID=2731255 RepID=A0A848RFC8_9FIRM|nr:gluconeogenesis factor YvcK family protein [Peptoniphilus faecalis]NMW85520.1 YvcK family protein [Peptoniphilus faecalis]